MYMTVLNIPPDRRSKLHCIQVVSVVSRSAIATEAQQRCFFEFIRVRLIDAEQDGVWFGRLSRRLPLKFQYVVGDNLGANQLMGLQMSFSAGSFCRWCLATYAEIQNPYHPPFELRTAENYAVHLAQRVCGVRGPALLTLPSVDLLKTFPQDIGHDIFEGVGKTVITHVFLYVYESYTSGTVLDRFNELRQRVIGFRLGPLDSGTTLDFVRMTTVEQGDDVINAKMDQVHKYMVFFPFLYGDLFEEGDKFLEMFLAFRSVALAVRMPSLNAEAFQRLRYCVVEYMQLRKQLVKTRPADSSQKPEPDPETHTSLQMKEFAFWHRYHFTIKPKSHFLVHLPDQIELFGPPRESETIRFEGKHKNLLEKRRQANNTINVPMTMVSREQEEIALRLHSSNFMRRFLDFDECNSNALMEEHRFVVERVLGAERARAAAWSKNCRVEAFEYRGIRQGRPPTAVLLPRGSDLHCGVVVVAVVSDSNVHLLCKVHSTVKYSKFGCYQLSKNHRIELIGQKSLALPRPLHVYRHPRLGECVIPLYDP